MLHTISLNKLRKELEPTKALYEWIHTEYVNKVIDYAKLPKSEQEEIRKKLETIALVMPSHSLLHLLDDTGFSDTIGSGTFAVELLSPAERGYVYHMLFDIYDLIIKPYQSNGESVIAQKASDEGIGPKIFKLGKEGLVEECINGTPFDMICLHYSPAYCLDFLGGVSGEIYGRMHRNGFTYSRNKFYHAAEGPRHIILSEQGPRIIDFGVAVLSDKNEDFIAETDKVSAFFNKIFPEEIGLRIMQSFMRSYNKFR